MTEFTANAAPPGRPRWTSGRALRRAVLAGGRGRLLAIGTTALVSHQICEAMVPVLIGMTIDHAVIPGDGTALLGWLAAMAGLFLVLSWSWRIGARRLIRVDAFGSHDLRMLATRRMLDPNHPPRRRPAGEVLSITSSDADRVAEFGWTLGQTAAATAGLITAAVFLLIVSVPLGVGVLLSAPAILLAMHLLARPLEARSETEHVPLRQPGRADEGQPVRPVR